MSFSTILESVRQYYNQKVTTYGATAQGVDWNSPQGQALRFEQLLKISDGHKNFSINDYGCGYGALVEYMSEQSYAFQYRGFDISAEMITRASELYRGLEHCQFYSDEGLLTAADYTVASGIFNVKLQTSAEAWKVYLLDTLNRMAELSEKGFAFNVLTSYSDQELRRSDLYYADPCFLFDYCKTNLSRHVSLLHDYGLYEFTLLVKK